MGNNNIIKHSNQGIVVEEIEIKLSDEKLSSMLLNAYEKASNITSKWHFYKLYSVLLSIAGTLFLALLTTTFNDVGQLKADLIRNIIIVATISCAVVGFIFLGISVNKKKENDTAVRNAAIKEIMEQYLPSKK